MIIGIKGNLGNGKTATMARLALHFSALCTECNGVISPEKIIPVMFDEWETNPCTCEKPTPYKIHSNFFLRGIPDVHYVTTLKDVEKTYQGVAFYDELWTWIDSRVSGFSDINLAVTGVLHKSRKRGYSLVYESKLIHMTDRRIRELTDYVLEPNKFIEQDGDLIRVEANFLYPINMAPYIDKTWIVVNELTGFNMDDLNENFFQFPLSTVIDLYDTTEEISNLGEGERTPGIEKGMKVENAFISAIKGIGLTEEVPRPDLSRGWDYVAKLNNKKYAFSVITPRIRKRGGCISCGLDIRQQDVKGLLKSARDIDYKPFWAFLKEGKPLVIPMKKEHIKKGYLTCTQAVELKDKL